MEKQIDPGEDFYGALDQITDRVARDITAFHESIEHLSPLEQERAWLEKREARVAELVELQAPDFLVENSQRLVEKSRAKIAELEAGEARYEAGYLPTPAKVDYNSAGLPPKHPIPRPRTMGEAEKGIDPRSPGGIGYDGGPGPGPGE